MRVLLSTIGSRGDVQPLVALASQLRARGHELRLCVPPDFQDWIASLDLPVTPIGPELRAMTAARPSATTSARFSPERRRKLAEATVATQFQTLTAAAQGCDMIVGATALQIAARSIAQRMGIPYVFAAYCPTVLPSPHHAPPRLPPVPGHERPPVTADNRALWARDSERFNDLFGSALNSHRASIGLAPVDDVRSHVFTERPWLAADPVLAPWPHPSDHDVFQTGAWILSDARPLSRELETFLASGEPPVYFGFGSVRPPQDLDPVMVRIRAARALGRRAIVSHGSADLSVLDDEADCLVIGDTNLHALFKRVAVVVHHGGAGTTTAAALAGAPQVVVPEVYDQYYWAQRVEQLRIGTVHDAGASTAGSLSLAIEHALHPDVAARANSMRTLVRRDGAEVAAACLVSGARERAL